MASPLLFGNFPTYERLRPNNNNAMSWNLQAMMTHDKVSFYVIAKAINPFHFFSIGRSTFILIIRPHPICRFLISSTHIEGIMKT
jgi:hypothetical protein